MNLQRPPCGNPEPESAIEADPGDDGQTPAGNRQQEEKKEWKILGRDIQLWNRK